MADGEGFSKGHKYSHRAYICMGLFHFGFFFLHVAMVLPAKAKNTSQCPGCVFKVAMLEDCKMEAV